MSASGSPKLVREFVLVATGQASAVLGSLVGLRVLTGLLVPEEFGILALAMTFSTLLSLTVFVGPGPGMLRFYSAAREAHTLGALIAAAWQSLRLRVSGTAILGAVICVMLVLRGSALWASVVAAVAVQAIFAGLSAVLDAAQNAARQRAIVAFHASLNQWLRFLIALPLFALLGATGIVGTWAYAGAAAIVFSSQLAFFRRSHREERPESDTEAVAKWRQQLEAYGFPHALWGIPYWVHSASERWALERFVHVRDVGLYAAVVQLGFGLMTIVYAAVVQFVVPLLFQRAGDGASVDRLRAVWKLHLRLICGFLALTAGAGTVAFLAYDLVFSLLVAAEFRTAARLWPLSVLAGGLFGCGQLAALAISSGRSNRPLLLPKVGSAVVGTAMTIIWASWWGLAGVIWASLVASALYFVWTAIVAFVHARDFELVALGHVHVRSS